jgi:hypothetical protein
MLYHTFRDEIISGLDDEWSLSERAIGDWIRQYRLRGSPAALIALDCRS